ncbi:MAG: NAD(P)/FAD-dependent oxidoreductase [Planctomycetota bacterium]|nr:NAD(P)/FAD-dependent oxidoreductase [Planctomycetota bacterium]
MDYDVIIIGAGMSGLAAGIRLAMFDRRVCIIERHYNFGGLNSFYSLDGRRFDVGLHALTNYVGAHVRNTPLPKLLRQLRISRDALDLCEQSYSAVSFPGRQIRFNNDIQLLIDEVAREFPAEADNFLRLIENIKAYDDLDLSVQPTSSRRVLAEFFGDHTLIDMLLCPLMYYGNAEQHDMDYTQFVTMFKSIYLQGFARPRQGVRRIVAELVKRYRECGGEFRMKCGVKRITTQDRRATAIELDDGAVLTAGTIISSAGYVETMNLCSESHFDQSEHPPDRTVDTRHAGCHVESGVGQLSFIESISVLDIKPVELGIDATIIFFNDAETFTYAKPEDLIDPRSGVICMPNNYERHDDMAEGIVRLTSLANYDRWVSLPEDEYQAAKARCYDLAADHAVKFIPEFRERVIARDIFTPRTIEHYTGHINGAVYGAPRKIRDGRTHLENLFICGTDQGFLGIIGAALSGISMANLHVLSKG